MMFSQSHDDRRPPIRLRDRDIAAADCLTDGDIAAGIGDNSAEVGNGAAGIVDIASNVIPC